MTNNNENINEDNYIHNEALDKNLMNHDYDGIKELDNPPPVWIMAIFYITIFIAVMYGAYYFWFHQGANQDQEYLTEVADFEQKYATDKPTEALALLTDEASLKEGQEIFQKNCFACHGMEGQGGIGANLTDDAWIHGCDFASAMKIVKEGGPNGMIAYQSQMSEHKIQQVVSYVLIKLKGTHIEGKAAQGVPCP